MCKLVFCYCWCLVRCLLCDQLLKLGRLLQHKDAVRVLQVAGQLLPLLIACCLGGFVALALAVVDVTCIYRRQRTGHCTAACVHPLSCASIIKRVHPFSQLTWPGFIGGERARSAMCATSAEGH